MTRVLIAGGGLAGGLLALRLAAVRRDVDVTILERGSVIGGNHTWSFHWTDLGRAERDLVAPLVAREWNAYEVRFPGHRRRLALGYASVRSARLDQAVRAAWPHGVRTGVEVEALDAGGARLADGTWIEADCVFDARGVASPRAGRAWGHQVFLGRDLQVAKPHGLTGPVLMDATVPQEGGFRFVYALPWDERTVLVEDTCYGGAVLSRDAARERIAAWAERQGWTVEGVRREEEGALPIPVAARFEDVWTPGPAVPIGVRAGMFHATTGYSLPWAARLAGVLADRPQLETRALAALVRGVAEREWRRQRFFRALNRLLFEAAAAGERYRVLERFYRLQEGLIARFYAGRPTWADKLRLLAGRPPVPLRRALRCALPARATQEWGA